MTSAENRRSNGICSISVKGFKCLEHESRVEIRPLTILAGANSSGKSSIMQPLLLMKQTLEASYDPGPLLLNGPNVSLTSVAQLVPRSRSELDRHTFTVSIEAPKNTTCRIAFSITRDHDVEIPEMRIEIEGSRPIRLTPGRQGNELIADMELLIPEIVIPPGMTVAVDRYRCFLDVTPKALIGNGPLRPAPWNYEFGDLMRMIHVPGLRGVPDRLRETTASGPFFPGTFEKYVPTVIADWTTDGDARRRRLEAMLAQLGMTGEVSAQRVNGSQLELQVGRLPGVNSRGQDLVSIADVGFGVSQVLPVLVALLVADEGQLVYVEQPEMHLHPQAQYALARAMVDAANRGGRLVAETHSALLLLHIRTLLAQGEIDPQLVRLHWFSRNPESGATAIETADVDERGAFGNWPEDFGDIELTAEGAYLDAVEERAGESGEAARS